MKSAAVRARRLELATSRYRRLLEQQWSTPGEPVLSQAYAMGRELLAAGVTLLETAEMHHRVLAELFTAPAQPRRLRLATTEDSPVGLTAEAAPGRIETAGRLLAEVLASHEMLMRGYGEANAALRGMHERLEEKVEQIARALHDESGQLLAAVMIRLDQAAAALPEEHRRELGAVRQLLDQVEVQLRRLSHELHPALLADLGLWPALEFLADGVTARSKLAITLEGKLKQRLPPPIELCLYRCVQECLNNVVRHAHAKNVRIQMRVSATEIEIRVRDDGRGFDPDAPPASGQRRGMGLAGMRERLRGVGGGLAVQANVGVGVEMRMHVPTRLQGGLI